MLTFPFIRNFIFLINNSDSQILFERTTFRGMGFSSDVTYGFSVQLSFGLLLTIILFYLKQKVITSYFIIYTIILFSIFFTARSGLLGFILSIFLMIFITIRNFKLSHLKVFIQYSTLFLISCTLCTISIYLFFDDRLINVLLGFTFEYLTSYLSTGTFSTSSTNQTLSMFYMPNTSTLLFGDALYMDGIKYYGNTDVGYLRYILYFGIFPSLLFYLFFIYIFYFLISKASCKAIKTFFVLLLFYYFILHAKGSFLNSSIAFKFLFTWLFFFLINSKKYIKEKVIV